MTAARSSADEVAKADAKSDPLVAARAAVNRGLAFLQKDAVDWRRQRNCATCHHGAMTVWAMSEAKTHGYTVSATSLKEIAAWTIDGRLKGPDKPRDARPGYNMVNTAALYLAVMARTLPRQDSLPAGEVQRIAGHLLRHQESDGSWAWSIAPPANRFPPVFESDEVATTLGLIALRAGNEDSDQAEARRKAAVWLAGRPISDSTQAQAFRILLSAETKARTKAAVERLLARQNQDGGWGQLPGLASDAYATGQVLYAVNMAGVSRDRAELQRGIRFLTSNQRPDGSWPMTPRAQSGQKPASLTSPIVHFGSSWAVIGLARSVPE
jgi:hypothetical protein